MTDSNGAVVGGARITAQSSHRRVVAVTDQSGEFALTLGRDEYTLKVVAEGFMDVARQINHGGLTQTLDIVLEVGVPSATVTITESAGYQIGAVRFPSTLSDIGSSARH